MNISDQDKAYIQLFEDNRSFIEQQSSPQVNRVREKAFAAFSRNGLPSAKNEAYKYTNLAPKFKADLPQAFLLNGFLGKAVDSIEFKVRELDAYTIYTFNGRYIDRGQNGNLPEGLVAGSFAELAGSYPELIEKYYGTLADSEKDSYVALNTMFATDGLFIYVPKNLVVEKPLQIVNILAGEKDIMVNQRNFIYVSENAQVKVLFCDHTGSSNRFVVNTVTEGFVGEAGILDFYNLQNQHNGTVQVGGYYFDQESKSLLNASYFTLSTGITRNNLFGRLNGSHAENHFYGLYLIDKNQHVDNYSFIHHAVPDCESNELFKGVMDDSSTGAFTGRILVAPDAQRTNAYQANNNLLLTSSAKMNTRPQLEIYADDVKCSHGATVGQLDEKAMFYLRARGISKEEANIMLMFAFAYEVLEKIRVPELKEQIRELVEMRFRGELDKCLSCVVCGQPGVPHLSTESR